MLAASEPGWHRIQAMRALEAGGTARFLGATPCEAAAVPLQSTPVAPAAQMQRPLSQMP